LTNLRTKII